MPPLSLFPFKPNAFMIQVSSVEYQYWTRLMRQANAPHTISPENSNASSQLSPLQFSLSLHPHRFALLQLAKMADTTEQNDLPEYIMLISSDGYEFPILRSAATVSGTLRRMLDPKSKSSFHNPFS
jgi:hypothetical protein